MGNYVIAGVGNYVIVNPSNLGNYVIADTQRADRHGHHQPLIATVTTNRVEPVIVAQRLRKGSCGSPRGAKRLVTDALVTVKKLRAGPAAAKVLLRADSALCRIGITLIRLTPLRAERRQAPRPGSLRGWWAPAGSRGRALSGKRPWACVGG